MSNSCRLCLNKVDPDNLNEDQVCLDCLHKVECTQCGMYDSEIPLSGETTCYYCSMHSERIAELGIALPIFRAKQKNWPNGSVVGGGVIVTPQHRAILASLDPEGNPLFYEVMPETIEPVILEEYRV